ncbi:hypothetical protein Q5H92_15020 [Hymenobacter sp. M29]|uniref:Uncharacterized protein n=1 Tax=Hymenobacter mellowenesis TaxID=3063995 RepID=A0ABT9ACU7_9BACT|nr:hypothetical protein [Hymenobacter sp. M29]MDO7847679.1 hypothetical protein [Hymenobacter sp. M29]
MIAFIILLGIVALFGLIQWGWKDIENKVNQQMYHKYFSMWQVAEQDNKWLRTILQQQFDLKTEGPQLGEKGEEVPNA